MRGVATFARCRRSRSTRPARATSTMPSPRRPFPDGSWRVWVHIADVSAYVAPRSLDRSRGLPPGYERIRARSGRADAPGGAVEQRVLARAGAGPAGRHGGDGDHRRARVARRLLPLGDPLRRAPRLRPGRSRVRGAPSGRPSHGASRWPSRGPRRARWRRGGRPRRPSWSIPPSPSSASIAPGT